MCVSVVCAGLKFVFGYEQWFEIYGDIQYLIPAHIPEKTSGV